MKKFLSVMGCLLLVVAASMTLVACGESTENASVSSVEEFTQYIETTFGEKEIKFENGFRMDSIGEGDPHAIKVSRTESGYNLEQIFVNNSGNVYSRVHLVDGKYYEYVLTDDENEIKTIYKDEDEFSANKNEKTQDILDSPQMFIGDLKDSLNGLISMLEEQVTYGNDALKATKSTNGDTTTFEFIVTLGTAEYNTRVSFRNGYVQEFYSCSKQEGLVVIYQKISAFDDKITAPEGYTPFSAE